MIFDPNKKGCRYFFPLVEQKDQKYLMRVCAEVEEGAAGSIVEEAGERWGGAAGGGGGSQAPPTTSDARSTHRLLVGGAAPVGRQRQQHQNFEATLKLFYWARSIKTPRN